MRRLELVSMRELLYCLVLASSAMDYTLLRFHIRASAASSHSTRVDLLRRSGSAQSELSLDHILHADSHRILLIIAKLSAAASPYAQLDSTVQSPLYSGQIVGGVAYVVKVGLGTPAKDLFLEIDTGSELAWTQCQPCDDCYQQHSPMFDPTASSSYRQVPCASAQCTQFSLHACSGTNCEYLIVYGDGSLTTGDLALDTLTIGGINPVSTGFVFGCGHDNEGLFEGIDGLVGFSRDPLSLPVQAKAALGEIFAYCMPPFFSSSAGYIEFGGGGEGDMTTPLVGGSSLYVVELEMIQVEGANSMSNAVTKNSMVVDSGTVITRLSSALYKQVIDAFKMAASSIMEAPEGAGMGIFEACYIASSASVFPRLTFMFAGGLAFTLSAQNTVFPVDDKGTFCLAILSFESDVSILGSYYQQGHLFTFDIAHSTLGISSGAC